MRIWVWLVVSWAAWLINSPNASAEQHAATPVRAFLDTLGVNTHIPYKDGAYAKPALVLRDLQYLGIHHVRDGVPDHLGPDTASLNDYAVLANGGMKFDLVVNAGASASAGKSFVEVAMQMVDMLQKVIPTGIAAIEGPNEINNWPVSSYKNLTDVPAALQSQRDIYEAVHANPKLRGVPVFDLTGAPKQPGFADRADYGNQHPYPHNAMQPAEWIGRGFAEAYALAGRYPRVITEIGNFSLPSTWPAGKPWWAASVMLGVDEQTQAKLILNAYFQAFAEGVDRTYVYELLDDTADPANKDPSQHYGLFHFNHVPKPAATAIHTVASIVQDGAVAVPESGGLDFDLLGLPGTANYVLLQKSKRVFILAIWNNVPFWTWDAQVSHAIQSPAASMILKLPTEMKLIEVIDPLHAAAAVQSFRTTKAVPLSIGDYPMLVVMTLY
jgi:hypothetical protein